MKYSVLSLTAIALSGASLGYSQQVGPEKKNVSGPVNVLFILADDLGYTDLSCMGSKYYETPNIDQIAHSGMVFTNGYAACQVCSPSRASILTGKFPARIGITDWIGAATGEEWRTEGRFSQLLPPENNDQPINRVYYAAGSAETGWIQNFFCREMAFGRLRVLGARRPWF